MEQLRRKRIFVVPQALSSSAQKAGVLAAELVGEMGERELRVRLRGNESCLARTVLDALSKNSSSLSGGEARRIYLWAAIASSAEVLFLDEPTTGLDNEARAFLLTYITLNPDGRMIILMTHDAELAAIANETIYL